MRHLKTCLGIIILLVACVAVGVSQSTYNFSTVTAESINGGGNPFFLVAGPATSQKTYTFENANRSIPGRIASGTSALGTSQINSGACASAVTTSATGAATTDNLQADFNADPTSTTGYTASAMLTIVKYITADNVNFKVCNTTGSAITPSAVTLQWRVIR